MASLFACHVGTEGPELKKKMTANLTIWWRGGEPLWKL